MSKQLSTMEKAMRGRVMRSLKDEAMLRMSVVKGTLEDPDFGAMCASIGVPKARMGEILAEWAFGGMAFLIEDLDRAKKTMAVSAMRRP